MNENIYNLIEVAPTKLNSGITKFLTNYGKTRIFNAGQVVVREGQQSCSVFIVLEGEASITKSDSNGNQSVIAMAGRGAVLGEMGVFLNLKRTGSIHAKTSLKVLEVNNQNFLNALINIPDLSFRILKSLSSKLSDVNVRLANLLNNNLVMAVGLFLMEARVDLYDEIADVSLDLRAISQQTQLESFHVKSAILTMKSVGVVRRTRSEGGHRLWVQVDFRRLSALIKRLVAAPIRVDDEGNQATVRKQAS